MNRLTPAPPVGAPPRFPSGWRARLGRDPVPILLREGGPALVARVRRDLIDDDEAPGPAEVVTYPEVKSFLKKQEKNGAFPAKPPEKTLGPPRFSRAVATLRALEKMAEFGLGKAHPAVARAAELLFSSQAADGGIGDLALGETPESRARAVAIHFQGWALSTLCRAGYDTDARIEKGFRFLLANRQADGGLGVARRAHRFGRPPVEPPGHRAWRCARSPPRRRAGPRARRAAPPSCSRPDSCSPTAIPIARRPATGSSSASRASTPTCSTRSTASTAVGLGKENSGVRTAEAYVRGRQNVDGLWYPGRAAARRARRQAAAAEPQGPRARALADRARADRLAPGQLTRLCCAALN